MPGGFIKDESVPVRWRLYGLINGFWLNGLPVYASNSFFSTQLGCSDRHISRALEELEKGGYLTRNVEGYKRLILQGGVTPDVRGGRHRGSGEGDAGGHPNASINASNIILGGSNEPREIVEVSTEKPREKKDTSYLAVFALWGKYPLSWRKNTTEIEAAKNLLAEHGLEDCKDAIGYYERHEKEPWIPRILSPSDLDRKWKKLEVYFDKNHAAKV